MGSCCNGNMCWQQLVGGEELKDPLPGDFRIRIRTPHTLGRWVMMSLLYTHHLNLSQHPLRITTCAPPHMEPAFSGRLLKVSWNPWSPPFRRPYGACLEDASPRCRARRRVRWKLLLMLDHWECRTALRDYYKRYAGSDKSILSWSFGNTHNTQKIWFPRLLVPWNLLVFRPWRRSHHRHRWRTCVPTSIPGRNIGPGKGETPASKVIGLAVEKCKRQIVVAVDWFVMMTMMMVIWWWWWW